MLRRLLPAALILVLGLPLVLVTCGDDSGTTNPPAVAPDSALEARLRKNCALCHQFPSPEILPRDAWRATLDKMFRLANVRLSGVYEHRIVGFTPAEAAAWFADRAPETFGVLSVKTAPGPAPVAHRTHDLRPARSSGRPPGVCNVHVAALDGPDAPPLLVVSDMLEGRVLLGDPLDPAAPLREIARLRAPSRVAATDLDRDGRTDLIVADLGDAGPTDERRGAVVWLRRTEAGDFTSRTLADDLGRVADVQAVDLDGDGDTDIVAAVFGWYSTGELLVLWNRTSPDAPGDLVFERQSLDQRSGAMNAPVLDVDGDGRLDIVALYSQEHERLVAYLQVVPGQFAARDLWAAPHPHWGHTNLDVVDLDGDGDTDFVLTNGDTLDDEIKLKPYHGVAWLENRGDLAFEHHSIVAYPGAHAVRAADMDGDGDLDLIAGAFLPSVEDTPETPLPPGLLLLEQTAPGAFTAHALREQGCGVATLAVRDLDGDGTPDIVAGTLFVQPPFPDDWERLVEVRLSGAE